MCLCHQAVQFGTGQRAVMLCGQEGNHRSGVALAMRHRLQWFIYPRAHGHREGDEHPTYAPVSQESLRLTAEWTIRKMPTVASLCLCLSDLE